MSEENKKDLAHCWAINKQGEIIEWIPEYKTSKDIKMFHTRSGHIRIMHDLSYWVIATKADVPKEFLTVLILNGLEVKFEGEHTKKGK